MKIVWHTHFAPLFQRLNVLFNNNVRNIDIKFFFLSTIKRRIFIKNLNVNKIWIFEEQEKISI